MFSLVTLWAAGLAATAQKLGVLGAVWYKKPDPTFWIASLPSGGSSGRRRR